MLFDFEPKIFVGDGVMESCRVHAHEREVHLFIQPVVFHPLHFPTRTRGCLHPCTQLIGEIWLNHRTYTPAEYHTFLLPGASVGPQNRACSCAVAARKGVRSDEAGRLGIHHEHHVVGLSVPGGTVGSFAGQTSSVIENPWQPTVDGSFDVQDDQKTALGLGVLR